METLKEYISIYRAKVDEELENLFHSLEKEHPVGEHPIFRDITEIKKNFVLGGGKRLRPILLLIGYEGVTGKEPHNDIVKVAAALEALHAYLLIHDDIADRDELRRNMPTVWKAIQERRKYDTHIAMSQAMFAGDILRSGISWLIYKTNLPSEQKSEIYHRLHVIDANTNYGQILDTYLPTVPLNALGRDEILKVYELKTARYTFEGPLGLGAILGGKSYDFYSGYAIPVGIAFQIADDILGLFGDQEKIGKPVGSDLREGKRTLLILSAYTRASAEDKRFLEKVLGKPNLTIDEIDRARRIVERTGALDEAKQMAKRLVEQGISALEELPIAPKPKKALEELAWYTIRREK